MPTALARAAKLSAAERTAIAKKAIAARWEKKRVGMLAAAQDEFEAVERDVTREAKREAKRKARRRTAAKRKGRTKPG